MNQGTSIKSFTDLATWQEAHKLVIMLYNATEKFPSHEQFGLTSQMRRAAVSITSNIAEGFSRDSFADKRHFYVMARGSLTELQSQLMLARDLKFLAATEFSNVANQAIVVHKLTTGLIKVTKLKA